jgi:hypothetical protein
LNAWVGISQPLTYISDVLDRAAMIPLHLICVTALIWDMDKQTRANGLMTARETRQ